MRAAFRLQYISTKAENDMSLINLQQDKELLRESFNACMLLSAMMPSFHSTTYISSKEQCKSHTSSAHVLLCGSLAVPWLSNVGMVVCRFNPLFFFTLPVHLPHFTPWCIMHVVC